MDRTVQLLTDMWNKLQNECNDVVTEENYDALKKAITALEQQNNVPDTNVGKIPCEDAISRQAAQANIVSVPIAPIFRDDDVVYRKVIFADVIDALPPVTVQEKPNRSKFEFDEEQEQIDFVQPHKKIEVNLVIFDTPYTDAISRQAAIDAMREETCMSCWDAKYILEHLPSVSTEKTGRWEWVQYDFDPRIGNWHCSECRNITVHAVKKDEVDGIPIAKYCPNCGARMGVEE